MKILFLSSWFPYPPDNGSRIRACNLLKALSAKHDVSLVSLMQEDSNPADASRFDGICRVISLHRSRWFRPGSLRSVLGFASRFPRSYVDVFDPVVRDQVAASARAVDADVVVASELLAMYYAPADGEAPVVFEAVEVGALHRRLHSEAGLRRVRTALMLAKHRNLLSSLLRKAAAFTCVTQEELDLVKRYYRPQAPGAVIPNGVDMAHYGRTPRAPQDNTLIYNGALTYSANLDAVRYYATEIYPILKKARPDVVLKVTGRTDGVDLRGIQDCPGVRLTGYVDDIRTQLDTSAVCVVPLRSGGGSRLKILEAFAAGVPVVATTVGAEGIEVTDGKHILIADTPEDFAAAVDRLLSDVKLARRVAEAARSLVEQRYDWNAIGQLLESVVLDAVTRRQSIR